MRRTDREVSDHLVIESVFNEADVCRVAFADNNTPYIVTMNFGFVPGERNVLYFHCAPEGRKIEMLHRNDLVCFTLDTGHELYKAEKACGWGMRFRSIVGYGRISVVENDDERRKALSHIMDHYGGDGVYDFNEKVLADTKILRLDISEITCKEKK